MELKTNICSFGKWKCNKDKFLGSDNHFLMAATTTRGHSSSVGRKEFCGWSPRVVITEFLHLFLSVTRLVSWIKCPCPLICNQTKKLIKLIGHSFLMEFSYGNLIKMKKITYLDTFYSNGVYLSKITQNITRTFW